MSRVNTTLSRIAVAAALLLGSASCGSSPSAGGMTGDGAAAEGGSGGADSTTGSDDSGGDSGTGASSGGSSGASSGGDGSCAAATGCPSGYKCGRYVDPCTGHVFACGTPCAGGQVCATSGDSQICQAAPSCSGHCGVMGVDSCGVTIDCGGCTGGKACVNNVCGPQTTVDAGGACAPLTCTPDSTTALCGTVADGCGNTLKCTCPSGQQCAAGVCAATPPECTTDGGARCGNVPNACGSGSVACGGCAKGSQCSGGTCTTCPAPSCGAATCGTAQNACGTSVSCGTPCDGGQVCASGSCCTPTTCAAALAAGQVTGCNPVDLGCGRHAQCIFCDGGTCNNDTCEPCIPRTCADFGNTGCGHQVGCGSTATLDCCASGTTCMGDVCCAPGQVNANGICCSPGQANYHGTCCTPSCSQSLPPGGQVSCGVTIYCPGG